MDKSHYWFLRGVADRLAGRTLKGSRSQPRAGESRDAYHSGYKAGGVPGFEEIHHFGAAEYGGLWLLVNEQIVDACRSAGVHVEQDPERTALSFAAYQIVTTLYQKGWIKERSAFAMREDEPGALLRGWAEKQKIKEA